MADMPWNDDKADRRDHNAARRRQGCNHSANNRTDTGCDSADNIPGAPGVGEKTAIKLLSTFNSLENLLERTSELKGKQKEKIEDNVDQILLSKKLATIATDIPISFFEDEFKIEPANKNELPIRLSLPRPERTLSTSAPYASHRALSSFIKEMRVASMVLAAYLAISALAGSMNINLTTDPLGHTAKGEPVYLADIWPDAKEVAEFVRKNVTRKAYQSRYKDVFKGDAQWRKIKVDGGMTYGWESTSTYVQNPPYFDGMKMQPDAIQNVVNARILGLFKDSITTDHISPAGSIKAEGPAGDYLTEHQIRPIDFNSYGARRGNHQVMMRGTFANIRLRNQLADGKEGGWTKHIPSDELLTIFDASERYKAESTPLLVIGGKEYGSGSSRDWAAKGTKLLGIAAVLVESYERIHRSNLN